MPTRRRSLLLLCVLVLAGCAGESAAPRYLYPPLAACPAVNPHVPLAPPAPLAAGFRPVAAARCTFDPVAVASREGVSGGWAWRTVQRSDGPFEALVSALRTPPETHRAGHLICPASVQEVLYVALTDAAGRTVVPAIPADLCGFRLVAVDRAIEAMTWRTVERR
jgi:hypothetical protein